MVYPPLYVSYAIVVSCDPADPVPAEEVTYEDKDIVDNKENMV